MVVVDVVWAIARSCVSALSRGRQAKPPRDEDDLHLYIYLARYEYTDFRKLS